MIFAFEPSPVTVKIARLFHTFGPNVMDIAYGRQVSGSATIYLNKGDYIDLVTNHDGVGSTQDIGGGAFTFMTVDFISI